MIVFVIFAVLLALAAEFLFVGKDLENVIGDYYPEANVVDPDEPFQVRIRLKNKSRRFIPFLRVTAQFEKHVQPQAGAVSADVWGNPNVSFSTWLRPRQGLERVIPVAISQRGRYVFRPLRLTGGDFLGLREQHKTCDRFCEVVAAPREAIMEGLPDMFGGFMGEVSVNRFILEDPVLTLGYREYTGREPMKMISWSQSARGGGLMVKKYDYTLEPTVSVVLNIDTRHPQGEELQEICYSLARTVCALLEKRGVKYAFTSNAILAGGLSDPGALTEGLGQRHFGGILEHLGRATGQCSLSCDRLLEKESNRSSAAGRILITPADDASSRALNRLREASGGNLLILKAQEVAK